ncbi:uncharacterized protein G2W53_031732 [Senna tora]|uniref:Uncharacterized protein n=1 Tax=Senna tora TaxID=362788 RepID=A0A834W9P6_9FABA|nr:uncharacterized protein G2W53_031732 [Senna tora]
MGRSKKMKIEGTSWNKWGPTLRHEIKEAAI